MKKVFIYGDSNVWGASPNGRLPDSEQWSNILQSKIGIDYKIVQEGLPGRYAGSFAYEPRPHFNGQFCYEPIYRTASPVDIVIIALGTNDLNDRYNRSTDEIVSDILWYENKTRTLIYNVETMPIFIYVLPPNFSGKFKDSTFDLEKREVVNDKLKQKVDHFVEISDVDLSADGLHFSPKGHRQMADAVFAKITESDRI